MSVIKEIRAVGLPAPRPRHSVQFYEKEEFLYGVVANYAADAVIEQSLARGATRVCAYGEMVDLLWRDGKPDAAIRLEELWNDLAGRYEFSLLCAYQIGQFYSERDTPHFQAICDTHRHVFPTEGFSREASEDQQARSISLLQQRAAALEVEIARRKDLEKSLREALAARRRAEDQNAFLLDASTVLAGSLDYETRLTDLANLAVPRLADWCAVDVVRPDGSYYRVGIAHADPEHHRIAAVYRPEGDRQPATRAIQTGQPQFAAQASDDDLAWIATGPEHLEFLRGLRVQSWLVVPMRLGDRTLGALTLVAAESGRRYSEADLPLAMELAHRAAISIENARLYQMAQQSNRAKDEFLATLSHELRTPLTAIVGWAKMLTIGGLDPETIDTAIHTIERSARTQATLIDDLLDLSKIVTGKVTMRTQPVDIAPVIENAMQTLRLAADAKGITIDAAPCSERLVVKGDPTRLQQIVWNLISNSIKFSDAGQRVAVALRRDGDTAVITVSDDGRGISPEFLPHVFEAFRQADGTTTRSQGGLGLGLAIVKHLVELHGGDVSAKSGGHSLGSTFTVKLPLASQHSTNVELPNHVAKPIDPAQFVRVVADTARLRS